MPGIFDIIKIFTYSGAVKQSATKSEALYGMAVIIGLIFIASLLMGALLLGLLFMLYTSIVTYSSASVILAATLTILLAVLILISLFMIINKRVRNLGILLTLSIVGAKPPIVGKISDITQSFIHGFTHKPNQQEN